MLKKVILLLFILAEVFNTNAQELSVQARLDTNNIRIGDQAYLIFEIRNIGKNTVQLPNFSDTIGKIEVIRKTIDTIQNSGTIQSIKQRLLITSFDSGKFAIPSFAFYFKRSGDTSKYVKETAPLTFHVNGIAVDTTKEIKDIKPPLEVPFSWKEFFKEYGWYIGGAILLAAIVAIIFYRLSKKNKSIPQSKPIPTKPAHLIALEELNTLENNKLWQKGETKEYHSKLSDILRIYLEHRFSINAMELTTDETMQALKHVNNSEKEYIYQVLYLSDMVKFAKAQPLPTENEQSMRLAREFVEKTKAGTISEIKEVEGK